MTSDGPHTKARKILQALPLEKLLAVASLDSSERWKDLWKLTIDCEGEDALYGFEGDAVLNSVVRERIPKEAGGECKCIVDLGGGVTYANPAAAPNLPNVRGKMCGRCGGIYKYRQDCGYCGRGIFRSGPGGWTAPNRCLGCRLLAANPYPHYSSQVVCRCEPLSGFKPRRKKVSK